MRRPSGVPCHNCAPKDWRQTPNLTGNHELDAVIMKNPNRSIPHRLEHYLDVGGRVYGSSSRKNRPSGEDFNRELPGDIDD